MRLNTHKMLLGFVFFTIGVVGSGNAQESDPSQLGSLKRIPATAGTYFVTTNHKAIVEAVFGSNAWQNIKHSAVSKGLKKANRRGKSRGYEDYNTDNPFAAYLQWYDMTFNNMFSQQVGLVVEQIVEHEVFFYVDNNLVSAVNAANQFYRENLNQIENGLDEDTGLSEETKKEILKSFTNNFRDIHCPTMMMGARLEDPRGFMGILGTLKVGVESLLNNLEADEFRDSWQVVDNERCFLLTFNIAPENFPLDELVDEFGDLEKQQLRDLQELLTGKQVTLAVGIVDDLLLAGIAKDEEQFSNFGDGEMLLDHSELAQLKKEVDANQAITSVSYVSERFAGMSRTWKDFWDSSSHLFELAIAGDDSMSPEEQKNLLAVSKWVKQVLTDLENVSPQRSLQFSYSKIAADGIRGYQFQQGQHPLLDGGQPIKLNQLANENSCLAIAVRPALVEESLEIVYRWLKTFPTEFTIQEMLNGVEQSEREALAGQNGEVSEADEATVQENVEVERKRIESYSQAMMTFLDSTRNSIKSDLLPAVSGQVLGVCVDLESRALAEDDNLTVILPAVVWGLNNPNRAEKAVDGVLTAVEGLVAAAEKELDDMPGDWREKLLPKKERFDSGQCVSYRWDVPKVEGVEYTVEPTIVVSPQRLIVSMDQQQAESLTKIESFLASAFGPANEPNDASMGVCYYDNRVVASVLPSWGDSIFSMLENFGVDTDLTQFEAERDTLQFTREQIKDHVQRISRFIGCWHGYSSRMYVQGDGRVTEYLLRFKDVRVDEDSNGS